VSPEGGGPLGSKRWDGKTSDTQICQERAEALRAALARAPTPRYLVAGFDHGAGHPFLFLDDAKAPNCRKNNGFKDLDNYSEWPKVAGAVIKAW
jgi:hypothetical protein